jgi:hypothetical protein
MDAGHAHLRWIAALVAVVAGASVLLLSAPAPPASARALIGIGDQKPAMFGDPRFRWLQVRRARLVVSWNVLETPWERRWIDNWLTQAHADGVEPLIAFGHPWAGPKRRLLPSVKAYRRAFLAFRARYPWIRDYTPWNEANHCSQPTCHHPERAAAYYGVVKRACRTCQIVAADVLDQPNMVAWLRAFLRAAPGTPRLWGLHNYLDANRLRSTGTKRLLGAVPGRVWFTETGGLVRRRHYRKKIAFEESADHAGLATSWILRLAGEQPRVKRIYLYQWNADSTTQVWDSGLVGPFGETRPAFAVLARFAGKDPSKAPGDQPTTPAPAPPPNEEPPPTSSAQPPAQEQQPPPAQQPPPPPPSPPPPSCILGIICGL